MATKIGRNDKCNCKSGKKFKNCCGNGNYDKYTMGQKISSEQITTCIEALKNSYPNYKIIDISDDLTESTYRKYQVKNYESNVIMLAEKNTINTVVFAERINSIDSNIMVMYRGSYRTFAFDDFENVIESVCDMID